MDFHFGLLAALVLIAEGNLELLGDASLFQNSIGGMAGQNLVVYGEVSLSNRAVPDFVISTARALKIAPVRAQDFLQLRRLSRHQDSTDTEAVSS